MGHYSRSYNQNIDSLHTHTVIQPPLQSSILPPRMVPYHHPITRTILYLLLLPSATLSRSTVTTPSSPCQDTGCESYYGRDARCVFVRHGNWSQIGREYDLTTPNNESLCQSPNDLDNCCRCFMISTTTTTTTTPTTTTTTTSPPGCTDVHGYCRAAFNGSGACIDVRQGDLTYIDIDIEPIDELCGAGPERCCECFMLKTEGSSSTTTITIMTTTTSTSTVTTTTTTSTSTTQIEGNIELRGGSEEFEGNVFIDGLPVCDDLWNDQDAMVVCRMLGYSHGQSTHNSAYGNVPDTFIMDNVACSGNEETLWDCTHVTIDDCGSHEGAGVICGNIELRGGSEEMEGNVFINGRPVCDDYWA